MFLNLLAATPAAIWLYLLMARAGYWRMRKHLLPATPSLTSAAKIVAVIPARNEADVIGRAVTSLLTQQLPTLLHIVVVDDASSDGTAAAALEAAELTGQADRFEVIRSKPLVPGWTGKLWSVSQGIAQAERKSPDYLLLTDADIRHAPATIPRLLFMAEGHGFDLVSILVRIATDTLAERLLIPAFVYFFLQLYPPDWIADKRAHTAGAAGGCMLVRTDALRAAGGIQAIAGALIDDCALAALLKNRGGRVWLGLSEETTSLRSYGGFAGVGRMISRSAFHQLKHSSFLLLLTIVGLFVTYVLPPVLLFSRKKHRVVLGGVAYSLMSITYWPVLRLYRQNRLGVLSLPLVASFYAGATLDSAVRYWNGTGGEWKGRVQDRL